jgi:hypothetical protein
MEFKKTLLGVFIVLALFLLMSCDQQAGKQYETTSKDRITSTTIQVIWLSEDRVDAKCKSLGLNSALAYRGCARSRPEDITVCEVYAVRPTDFDDHDTLYHFGHEVWHCLGAQHK